MGSAAQVTDASGQAQITLRLGSGAGPVRVAASGACLLQWGQDRGDFLCHREKVKRWYLFVNPTILCIRDRFGRLSYIL